ncbi:hypothetical protein OF83DRAFT_1237812 [Amylostereum chailletii]|nr:hypothetical protein OF83DRAFT_1237812 [Amylostereum chailletii]
MRTLSPRDAILILLGAACMHIYSYIFPSTEPSIILNTHLSSDLQDLQPPRDYPDPPAARPDDTAQRPHNLDSNLSPRPAPSPDSPIPSTTLIKHAPGWTIFENIYMSNGTMFIVTDKPDAFPSIELVTSTGLAAVNTPENIAARMPTSHDMSVISTAEAHRRWGDADDTQNARIFPVEGNTFLVNDPHQFLNHYYHFCAELIFGAWAFWTGTYPPTSTSPTPPFDRFIFAHSSGEGWRDGPGMNAYFLRAAFPSLTVETDIDWHDRVRATAVEPQQLTSRTVSRAWRFDSVLFADRSAAFRGTQCGHLTQRTAAEAMLGVAPLSPDGKQLEFLARGWWEPVRRAVLRFAGVPEHTVDLFSAAHPHRKVPSEQVVVTYISRQNVRRRLVEEDHQGLVRALEALCERRGWQLNVIAAEKMTKEQQIGVAAKTTYLVGVHGNGLSHLIMMPPTPAATVFELFYPEGYAHDYEWTSRALSLRHFAVRNDTSTTFPEVTWPNYPEGFQGNAIPVHGPYVAKLIEDRADGRL